MHKYYTKAGLKLKQGQLKIQEDKVKTVALEVGFEAGPNFDWHDNFGYEEAKRKLELESSILGNLREELLEAVLVEVEEQDEIIKIGNTVEIIISDQEKTITIGAFGETNAVSGLITYTSLLGKTLLNMNLGESKNTQIGGKILDIKVKQIFPPSHSYYALIAELMRMRGGS